MPSIGSHAQLACIWEATARKPGNVTRFRDFPDLTYLDLILSAAAIAPEMDRACERSVGATVLACIQATRQVVATNTNLGIVLLLAPLAALAEGDARRAEAARLLRQLTVEDARDVFEAVRLAVPGGLGKVPDQDVSASPTLPLQEIMALAADRDLIARQYVNGFEQVLGEGVPALEQGLAATGSIEGAIVHCQVHLLARYADSLITRKCGVAIAAEASRRAGQTLLALQVGGARAATALAELDAWLRADGHDRNPGTTADLVTACLFVLLRDGRIHARSPFFWPAGFDHD